MRNAGRRYKTICFRKLLSDNVSFIHNSISEALICMAALKSRTLSHTCTHSHLRAHRPVSLMTSTANHRMDAAPSFPSSRALLDGTNPDYDS